MGQVKTVMLNRIVNNLCPVRHGFYWANGQRETFAINRRCTAENKGNKKQKSTSNNNKK